MCRGGAVKEELEYRNTVRICRENPLLRGPIPGTIHNLCVEFNNKILSPKTRQKQPLAKGNLSDWYTGTPKTRGTQIATSADGARRMLPGSKNETLSILAYQYLCDHMGGCPSPKAKCKAMPKKPKPLAPKQPKAQLLPQKRDGQQRAAKSGSSFPLGNEQKRGFLPFFCCHFIFGVLLPTGNRFMFS